MLTASLDGTRIDAAQALRGPEYRCPNPQCGGVVLLKKGRIVRPYFGHKPPTDCTWATGETRAHLDAKALVQAALIGRDLKAEVEFVVNTLPGDRRADVMAWSPSGKLIAFELQHTSIDLNQIEARASSYARAGIAQIWIPFLRASVWKDGKPRSDGWFVERYSPRPFEKWVHGFNGKHGMWMYDPAKKEFWLGRMKGHQSYVEETTFYADGEEQYGGGFYKWSKRYKELTLQGPHTADRLKIKLEPRKEFKAKGYSWPSGRVAHLTPVVQEGT